MRFGAALVVSGVIGWLAMYKLLSAISLYLREWCFSLVKRGVCGLGWLGYAM